MEYTQLYMTNFYWCNIYFWQNINRKISYLLQAVQVHPFSVTFNHSVFSSHIVQIRVFHIHPVTSSSHRPGENSVLIIQEAHPVLSTCTEDQNDLHFVHLSEILQG